MWLSPDGTDWAWAREEALRCLSRLGGWDRTVLKSHLRPLKRSLDSRPPTSGVWQSLQRAKVFTWSHHKGTRIGLWPSFEGRVNQSQSRLVVNLDRLWFRKFVPSINDSLSCSFNYQMSSHSRYGDKGPAAEDREKRRNAGRNGTSTLMYLVQ